MEGTCTARELCCAAIALEVGITAQEISKAERGELELSQSVLKAIAKATGVTQSSLINAARESTYSGKGSTAKTAAKTTAKTEYLVTAEEKKLIQLYRKADEEAKKEAMKVLQNKEEAMGEFLQNLLGAAGKKGDGKETGAAELIQALLGGEGKKEDKKGDASAELIQGILGQAMSSFLNNKK